ncbi:uncharacterized protein LOC143026888 [Oratosquilla oratoria]|uniref:uncharacterized protein LOC143026888 n=1 Tax=Oratosquilla oratoria TaxID=337810 RepID=UPI003F76656B
MTEPHHDLTPTGIMRRLTIAQVCEWVKKSWDDIRPEIIVKSFNNCDINNALDGTEDDALFEVSDSSSGDEYDEDFSGFENNEDFSEIPDTLTAYLRAVGAGDPTDQKVAGTQSADSTSHGGEASSTSTGGADARYPVPRERTETGGGDESAIAEGTGEEGSEGEGRGRTATEPCRGAMSSSRNALRERTRVESLRKAYQDLQAAIPSVPPNTKLSKLDVLALATSYISHLSQLLEDDKAREANSNSVSCPASSRLLQQQQQQTVSGMNGTHRLQVKGLLNPVKKWPMRSRLYTNVGITDDLTVQKSGVHHHHPHLQHRQRHLLKKTDSQRPYFPYQQQQQQQTCFKMRSAMTYLPENPSPTPSSCTSQLASSQEPPLYTVTSQASPFQVTQTSCPQFPNDHCTSGQLKSPYLQNSQGLLVTSGPMLEEEMQPSVSEYGGITQDPSTWQIQGQPVMNHKSWASWTPSCPEQ